MAELLAQLNSEMASVVAQVQRSLVQIRNGRHGMGAGIIWRPDGLIVTNAHVVGQPAPRVRLADGQTYAARILAHDARRDLAALQVDAGGLPAVEMGDSRALQAGEWVMALGHPWGIGGAATAGVVIGAGPDWPRTPWAGQEWILVRLHLRPGYSGGPLIDARGRLVGINSMVVGPELGAAVPVHVVEAFLQRDAPRRASPAAEAIV